MYLPNQDQPDLSLNMSPIETEAAYDPLAALKVNSPILPVLPDPVPPVSLAVEQVVGNYHTGPMPGAKNKTDNTEDFVKGVKNFMQGASYAEDPLKYAKSYSFGNDTKSGNFERYYGHNLFGKIGFSPYRDNETWYNEKGSWWDDFSRMTTQIPALVYSAFKSVYGDEKDANEAMQRGMDIGMSSRPGIGSWINNQVLQSTYTFGIISEVILEDFALTAAEAFTMGGASALVPGQIARNSMIFGKLAKGIDRSSQLIRELSAVDKAKDFWTLSNAGNMAKTAAVGTLEFLNPLSHTTQWAKDLYQGGRGVKNMGELAKATKTFGNFYRDARELNLAYSESRFEGESASTDLQDELTDKYFNDHGSMPDQKVAEEIYQAAQNTKANVKLANVGAIYFTNKLVFENLFKGWKPGAQVAKSIEHAGNRFLKKTAAKEWKIGQAAYETGVKSTRKKAFDVLTKSAYLPWSKRYILGNLAEGLQESMQEAISYGYKDYYRKIYEDPSQVGYYKVIDALGKGVDNQFNAEGLNTFLSGYLMGSIIQGGTAAYQTVKQKAVTAYTKTDKVALEKERQEQESNSTLNAANHVLNNFQIYGDHNNTMATAVKLAFEERNKAIDRGDTKTAFDMADQGNAQYFHHIIKTGNKKLVTDWADDMLKLSDQDLADATNTTVKESGSNRKNLNTLKERIERYDLRYKKVEDKFPNPFNPWLYSQKKNPEGFDREYHDYEAHENTVADLLFSMEDFTRISERMESISRNLAGQSEVFQNLVNVNQNGTPVANAAAHDVSLLIDGIARTTTIQTLSDQISIMKKGTPEQQKQVKPLEKQVELLKKWDSTRDFYMTQLKAEKKPMTKKERSEKAKQLKVRPGAIATHDKTAEKFKIVDIKGDKVLVETASGKTKYVSIKSISVVKAATVKGEFDKVYGDDVSFAIGELYNTYKEYLGHVTDMKKGYAFDDQLDEAFRQIKDFLHLQVDSFSTVKAINFLSNPDYFEQYRKLQSNIVSEIKTQRLFFLDNALKNFNKLRLKNDMLNKIYDLGLFVLPDDIESINDFNVPENFYNVTNKEIVNKDNPKYEEAVKVITEYAELAGKKVTTAETSTTEEGKPTEMKPAGKTPVSQQPPEQPEEEELGPNEPVRSTTSFAIMQSLEGNLIDKLIKGYKQFKEELDEAVEGDTEAILADDDFKSYVQSGGTALDIIDDYNQEYDRDEEPEVISPKSKLKSDLPYTVGKKHNFSGIVTTEAGSMNLNERPVEVITKAGVFVNEETGKKEELVILEDQETGDRYTIDLLGENAKGYMLKPYTEVENPEAMIKQAKKYYEKVIDTLDTIADFIEKYKTLDKLTLDEKIKDIEESLNDIVDNYSIDPASVKEYMKSQKDTLIDEIYKKYKAKFFDMLDNLSKSKQLKFDAEETEEEEENTIDEYTSLMEEYEKINDEDSLTEWHNKALDLKSSGIIPASIKITTLVNAKMNELANSVKWEDLTKGKLVILKNGKKMYVVSNEDNIVSLVTQFEWASKNFANSMEIDIDDYKDQIAHIVNGFNSGPKAAVKPTQDDIEDMDEGYKDVQEDDTEEIKDLVDSVETDVTKLGKTSQNFFDDMINDINNCNI